MFQQPDEFLGVITVQTARKSDIIYKSALLLMQLYLIYFALKSEALWFNPAALNGIFHTSSYFLGMFPEPDSFCLS